MATPLLFNKSNNHSDTIQLNMFLWFTSGTMESPTFGTITLQDNVSKENPHRSLNLVSEFVPPKTYRERFIKAIPTDDLLQGAR